VLALRQTIVIACGLLGCATLAIAPGSASAQGRLEAHYRATLGGVEIGKGTWVIEIDGTHYKAATSGVTTGLMHVITQGEGTSAVRGTIDAEQHTSSVYSATIISRRKSDKVRVVIEGGDVKDFEADPPPDDAKDRVPITEEQRHGVVDPLTASLIRIPAGAKKLSADACRRTLPIFDGRMRYDLKLAFKRMDTVTAEKGYAGPVVVCSVYFSPLGGHIPSRTTIKYISKLRDMELWLAPIAGSRVMVPFRAQGPTPIGLAVLEATQFVSVAKPTRASAEAPKVH
jgi:hypothetical protein